MTEDGVNRCREAPWKHGRRSAETVAARIAQSKSSQQLKLELLMGFLVIALRKRSKYWYSAASASSMVLRAANYETFGEAPTPSFRSKFIIGHQSVKAD